MSKSIGESLFEVLIMLNFTAKIHFFVRTAKFLTKKLSKIFLFYVSLQPNCNKQNFYSLISETSNEPITLQEHHGIMRKQLLSKTLFTLHESATSFS